MTRDVSMRYRLFAFAMLLSLTLHTPGRAGETAKPSPFLEQVRANFAAWDLDHDGKLEPKEIELDLANPAIKGDAAAAMAALRRAIRANKSREAFTLAELESSVPYRADADPPMPKFEAMFASAQERIAKSGRELFKSGKPQLRG